MKYYEIKSMGNENSLGRIILEDGKIRFEGIPKDYQKFLEYGIMAMVGEDEMRRVNPKDEPELFFEKVQLELTGGRVYLSEVQDG